MNAHLPYLKDTSKYRIVALLNSSEDAAKAAISSHGLSPETKAYGSPEQFAEDSDIDMVVCSVRVDRHYPILRPILEKTAARAVHCEWPLGKNLAEAEDLTQLAKSRGMKTVVGLQGRKASTGILVKDLIAQGKIGKPLSVTITAIGYNFGVADFEALSYLSDLSIGGNLVTIHFSHILDTITQAVGQLSSYSVVLDTKRKKTLLRNKPFTYVQKSESDEPVKIVGEVPRTSYDQIAIQGHLENGAVFSFHMRGGHPFPNTPGLDWRIYGETGEIRVTAPSANLHFGGPGHIVQLHNHQTDAVDGVEIPADSWDDKLLPYSARAPARVYEAFADGRENEYATWEDAVRRHRLVEEMYTRSRDGSTEKKTEYHL